MMHGRFERMKCSFGTAASSAIPTIPLPIPGLPRGCDFPDLSIEGSKMLITRYVILKLLGLYTAMLMTGKGRVGGVFQHPNKWDIKPH